MSNIFTLEFFLFYSDLTFMPLHVLPLAQVDLL